MRRLRRSVLFAVGVSLISIGSARAALPRFPQPYGDRIVFVADGNVWSVAKAGGTAVRLTSAAGQDMFPRVSPDGRWIAHTEASHAGTDVWVVPAAGGAARRLTFNPTTEAGTGGRHGPDNMVVTWTPDSRAVVYLTKRNQWNSWIQEIQARRTPAISSCSSAGASARCRYPSGRGGERRLSCSREESRGCKPPCVPSRSFPSPSLAEPWAQVLAHAGVILALSVAAAATE